MNSYPSDNDILFQEEKDPRTGAWLQPLSSKFFLYSEGYKQAGNKIYEACMARNNRFDNQVLIYPMVFCYRHFVELRLKELLMMGHQFIDVPRDFDNTHRILQLWKCYRDGVLPKIEKTDAKLINNVSRLIEEFDREDSNSMSYRYPVDRGKSRPPLITRHSIDIEQFKIVMDKLILFLDSQWDMLTHYMDIKQETIAEISRQSY